MKKYLIIVIFILATLAVMIFIKSSTIKPINPYSSDSVNFTYDSVNPINISGYEQLLPFSLDENATILSFKKNDKLYRLFINSKNYSFTLEESYQRVLNESKEIFEPYINRLTEISKKTKTLTHYLNHEDLTLTLSHQNITIILFFTELRFAPTQDSLKLINAHGFLFVK